MKPFEEELKAEIARGSPFTLVTSSGERVKVRSQEHIFLPPTKDEDGHVLIDEERSDVFEVWSDGRSKRLIAFKAINIIETMS